MDYYLFKKKGIITKKENKKQINEKLILNAKESNFYKKIIDKFPDSELVSVIEEDKND